MTTKLEQAARQALEALIIGNNEGPLLNVSETITALREALDEQAEQEPVRCVECGQPTMHMGNKCYACCQLKNAAPQPVQETVAEVLVNDKDVIVLWHKTARQLGHQAKLYAAPPRTKDLTDDEIVMTVSKVYQLLPMDIPKARAVIAADRSKNK